MVTCMRNWRLSCDSCSSSESEEALRAVARAGGARRTWLRNPPRPRARAEEKPLSCWAGGLKQHAEPPADLPAASRREGAL